MNTAIKIQRRNETKTTHLRVVHRKKAIDKQKLVSATMYIALSALWNNDQFSAKDKNYFKKLISEHYNNEQSNEQTFIDLAERICLVKRYIVRDPQRYVTAPTNWFNIRYSYGLTGTKKWTESINEQRKLVPLYNQGIRTFAKAVLDYIKEPSAKTFSKYRKELIEQKQFTLLDIFYKTIINLFNHA